VCERAKNKNTIASEHRCFLNWKGSATGMEADAIADGFSKSIELHGIKFNKLIGIYYLIYIILFIYLVKKYINININIYYIIR